MATGDGLGRLGTGLAAATGLAAVGDPAAGAVATAVANVTDGPAIGLASGLPVEGDATAIGWAVAVGVGARGASTSVVLV